MKINIEIDEEHVEDAIKKLELLEKLWVDIIELRALTEEIYDMVKDRREKLGAALYAKRRSWCPMQ